MRVTFRSIKLRRYVIVDVGGNYVTFHTLDVRINTKKDPNNSSHRELGLPVPTPSALSTGLGESLFTLYASLA